VPAVKVYPAFSFSLLLSLRLLGLSRYAGSFPGLESFGRPLGVACSGDCLRSVSTSALFSFNSLSGYGLRLRLPLGLSHPSLTLFNSESEYSLIVATNNVNRVFVFWNLEFMEFSLVWTK